MSRHILILGAGLMQKPAVESAKKLGWHVTVADGNPSAVCAPLADQFENIDLKDLPALSDLCKKMKAGDGLDAVFTAGTDFSAAVAYLAEQNGLPGHSYEAACNATDKIRMRKCFAAANVKSPAFVEVSGSSVNDVSVPFGFPVVVKPVDNMGARGCRICRTESELNQALKTAVSFSRTGRAVVEEYMDGPEFSLDSLLYEGKLVITGFADRHIFYPPYFIEMGHTMSTELPPEKLQEVAVTFEKGIRALGLSCGACKGDMKLTSKGAGIGEIAARLSGGYMSGWTFPYASGINLTEQALLIAMGIKPPLFEESSLSKMKKLSENVWYYEPKKYSAERAWVSIPGVVKEIYGYEKAEKIRELKDLLPRAENGSNVVFPVNNVEKCGNCITLARTRKKAVISCEDAVKNIVMRLKTDEQVTEDFLNQKTDFPPSAFVISEEDYAKIESLSDCTVYDTGKKWQKQIPSFLLKYTNSLMDWNHKTMKDALNQFETYFWGKVEVPCKIFWKYLLRGSVQGLLYLADKIKG
ncbi:MAG: ATP-grasp domain-containing protein [Spirochaetaceae bacterium]|nr:ATP-grasp domain-containing protein [Spirochaetaceae bacterium]MBP5329511.1 ATP-grasp domain-containing protein [Spirochaetaceae bacterium]